MIIGKTAKEQFLDMVSSNDIIIMKESELSSEEITDYHNALNKLASEMDVDLNKKRDRNAGEARSMAMAFAKDCDYFISDDRDARVAARRVLQRLDGSCLVTISMKDVIVQIKNRSSEVEIYRKTAKQLYLYGANPRLARTPEESRKLNSIKEHLKHEFDNKLWPGE